MGWRVRIAWPGRSTGRRLARTLPIWLAGTFLLSSIGTMSASAPVTPRTSAFDLRPVPVMEAGPEQPEQPEHTLFLPAGFSVQAFARLETPVVRALAVGPLGEVYASLPRQHQVWVFLDRTGDGYADFRGQVAASFQCPYGLAIHDGWLYVAQTRQVVRYPLAGTAPGELAGPGQVMVDDLPPSPCAPHHYRPLALDPARDALYVAIGSTCNVCIEEGPGAAMRATVRRYPLAKPGPGEELASGLRNVVGLALNPWDGTLWGVNPERDDLGDDEPPEQITAIQPGGHYGWPACWWGSDGDLHPDRRVGTPDGGCGEMAVPSILYQAHSSPLGLAFHDGRGLPPEFGRGLFVAFHGSWNHSTGVGYKVIRVPFDDAGQPSGPIQEFALGWITGLRRYLPNTGWDQVPDTVWGRPVDVAIGPKGELYVSDDFGGVIYRLAYNGG